MLENLKALRKQQGLTQEQFAKQFGVKKTTYSNYEVGFSEPPKEFWTAVAEKYRVSIDYLMDVTDNPKGSKFMERFPTSSLEKQLVSAWRAADEKDRRMVAVALEDYGFEYQRREKEDAG